jgi:dephospho-CoA kinase
MATKKPNISKTDKTNIIKSAYLKKKDHIIIGLTGTNSAGKGTVADFLKKKGFVYFSLSDIIREEATKQGLDHSRDSLVRIGNQLREKHGASVLGLLTAKKIADSKETKFIVDSIRNPSEIEELRKLSGFYLIAIDADVSLRYERSKIRGRNENASSLELFIAQENKEKSSDSKAQQLHNCIAMADFLIENNSGFEELYLKVEDVLGMIVHFGI